MKPLLLFAISIFLACSGFAQDVVLPTNDSGKVVYQETISVNTATEASVLYNNALTWFTNTTKPGKPVVQSADRISATVSGNVRFPCKMYTFVTNEGYINCVVVLSCKKGSYNYIIKDLRWQSLQNSASFFAEELLPQAKLAQNNKKMAKKTSEEINNVVLAIISQIKTAMQK